MYNLITFALLAALTGCAHAPNQPQAPVVATVGILPLDHESASGVQLSATSAASMVYPLLP